MTHFLKHLLKIKKTLLNRSLIYIIFLLFMGSRALAYDDWVASTSELCIINPTPASILINKVELKDQSFASEKRLIDQLVNQIIQPSSATCWTLENINSYRPFLLEIKTNQGLVAWQVNQREAIGEIHARYPTVKNETSYSLLQKAGDNNAYATNAFILEEPSESQELYLSNWMKQIPDSYRLKDIQLIGSHDAGINIADSVTCNIPSVLPAIAQAESIRMQALHGVRYFDIRLEGSDAPHYPYHRFHSLGCSSQKSFENSLLDLVNFIQQHPSETVFLKISHTASPVESVIKTMDQWVLSEETGRYFYKTADINFNWATRTLGELRGKIVLLMDCEYGNYLNPQRGYFAYSSSTQKQCSPDDADKIVYDHYTNSKDFNVMFNDQLKKLTDFGPDKNTLFQLSWTLTGGDIVAHTPRAAATLAILSPDFGVSRPLPNIVSYDFTDPGINKILIVNYLKFLNSHTINE